MSSGDERPVNLMASKGSVSLVASTRSVSLVVTKGRMPGGGGGDYISLTPIIIITLF